MLRLGLQVFCIEALFWIHSCELCCIFFFYNFRQDIHQLRLENEVLEQRLATFGIDDATFSECGGIANVLTHSNLAIEDEDYSSDD